MAYRLLNEGSITTPAGFRVTGIHCGLKTTSRDRDLGLLITKTGCTATGHFGATSGITGAWTTANLRRNAEDVRAVLLLTGVDGGRGASAVHNCHELANLLAEEAWIKPEQVVLLAAGAAGQFDMDLLRRGVPRGLDELDSKGGRRLALALAQEPHPTAQAAVEVEASDGTSASIGGLASSGDAPRWLITTNAKLSTRLLNRAMLQLLEDYPDLDQAAVLILANPSASLAPTSSNQTAYGEWYAGLAGLIAHLSEHIR
ncbi:bifunctional ornithine acetyltransferase/N-acetylglutamate synthase [Herpetosiphon giganteus]|uniref:bifunctional ornithine acetyltransferase/N-acetylglutamate synthase n=1 Tax=Herpetosiphon giganteus TaxID=2029754 RepID=UPI0019564016|nr:bifunctional ornithine acetyltransferase/N-acetylglutamate synthase [Herpetosiphon giganteus]MBM7846625.1 glutamate N-acetyltransferase/amino-acid N-acetyltransferase [Herpetosiphon giganteus]